MYLVTVPVGAFHYWVFLREDPRPDCHPHPVTEGVEYDSGSDPLRWWASGPPPALAFGRSKSQPHRFKLFRDRSEMDGEGFEALDGLPWVHQSWQEFLTSPQGRALGRLSQPEPQTLARRGAP